jgi:hypothetical protein
MYNSLVLNKLKTSIHFLSYISRLHPSPPCSHVAQIDLLKAKTGYMSIYLESISGDIYVATALVGRGWSQEAAPDIF